MVTCEPQTQGNLTFRRNRKKRLTKDNKLISGSKKVVGGRGRKRKEGEGEGEGGRKEGKGRKEERRERGGRRKGEREEA